MSTVDVRRPGSSAIVVAASIPGGVVSNPLIQLIVGSTRESRFSARAAAWTEQHLAARGDMDIEVVDLRDHPLPFFDGMAPARTLRDYPSAEVARFGQRLDRADGFVFVSPEYNHGYPAV